MSWHLDICVRRLLPPYPPPIFPTSSRLSHDSLSRPNLAEMEKNNDNNWKRLWWEWQLVLLPFSVAKIFKLLVICSFKAKRGFLRRIDWDYFASQEDFRLPRVWRMSVLQWNMSVVRRRMYCTSIATYMTLSLLIFIVYLWSPHGYYQSKLRSAHYCSRWQ